MPSIRARRTLLRGGAVLALVAGSLLPASAETLSGALAKAYENNPTLNALRAQQRQVDEQVPLAQANRRPTITGELDYSLTGVENVNEGGFTTGGPTTRVQLNAQQNLFNGFQTINQIRQAKANVFSQQEQLRGGEQDILLAAVQAYVNVVRDRRIVDFRQQNIAFLDEQLRAAQARFEVGEGTRTDVAQARAERAAALAELEVARANVRSSEAFYAQIVGRQPDSLAAPQLPTALLPRDLTHALDVGNRHHPAIRVAQFQVESGVFNVKRLEGTFLPSVNLRASVAAQRGAQERNLGIGFTESFTVGANVQVPIYRGGGASAQVRQATEGVSQARIQVDEARRDVRAGILDAFARYNAALASRDANRVQIDAARLAVEGLIEERAVGQRTTLDVLLGQQTLINAQVVSAQNDAVLALASYQLVEAIGKLSAKRLGLHVALHDPDEHYLAVKDKWYGLRTPDQR